MMKIFLCASVPMGMFILVIFLLFIFESKPLLVTFKLAWYTQLQRCQFVKHLHKLFKVIWKSRFTMFTISILIPAWSAGLWHLLGDVQVFDLPTFIIGYNILLRQHPTSNKAESHFYAIMMDHFTIPLILCVK